MSHNFKIMDRAASSPGAGAAAARAKEPTPAPPTAARTGSRDGEVAKFVQRTFICPETAKSPAVVAFCGVDQGAGCSWVCAQAAETLAENLPGRVCVVDANFRSPSLHLHFGADLHPGLMDALKEQRPISEYVRPTWSNHLSFVTSGSAGAEPNGAFNLDRLRTRFSELRAEFDHVLIDTPPIIRYPDAALLGRVSDGVVLIVASHLTRRDSARAAKESLDAAGVPILGAVLNKRTYPIPEALYKRL